VGSFVLKSDLANLPTFYRLHYIRYADDFVLLCINKQELKNIIPEINNFLNEELKITLHPDKIYIKTLASGLDFLGWVNFSDHRVLRTVTKRWMLKRVETDKRPEVFNSYFGLLGHGNAKKLIHEIVQTPEELLDRLS